MTISNKLYDNQYAADSPARSAVAITPHNTTEIIITRAIYVGVGGDITVTMADTGTSILFKNVPTGAVLPISVKIVASTGTTATNLIGLY